MIEVVVHRKLRHLLNDRILNYSLRCPHLHMSSLLQKETLRTKYAHAIEARALAQADEIADLTRRVVRGEVPPDVARVALDGLKWTASRLLPKIYGDRQSVDVAVTHTHQLHLDALKRLNDTARALPGAEIIDGEYLPVSD